MLGRLYCRYKDCMNYSIYADRNFIMVGKHNLLNSPGSKFFKTPR